MTSERKTAVVAIGGNSLIADANHRSVPDQFAAARRTAAELARMVDNGWNIVVTHGNGPQVGFIMRRSELSLSELHHVPMDSAGADTQGAIGYMLQQCLRNELDRRGIDTPVVSLVTQVRVDEGDPAFSEPSKPIGSFMDRETAEQCARSLGWRVAEDAGRGWRRVVPSPMPIEIVELPAIAALVRSGVIVIAAGGGGIPVVSDGGVLRGVEAVVDKDHASALLAEKLQADVFVISTAVRQVYLDFGKPTQRGLSAIRLDEAREYLDAGHFAKGNMAPKIEAAAGFVSSAGGRALITDPGHLVAALEGRDGTHIIADHEPASA